MNGIMKLLNRLIDLFSHCRHFKSSCCSSECDCVVNGSRSSISSQEKEGGYQKGSNQYGHLAVDSV
jgi:hypothetical protein